jgi:hypothetical protein
MADLTDLQSAETIKIAGANPSSGIETNYADVDTNGNLKVVPTNTPNTPLNVKFPSTGLDAFGRLRVSEPQSLFETSFLVDDQPLLFSKQLTSCGTANHNINKSSIDFATTTVSGSKAVMQSKQYFSYHPGKSHLMMITGNLGGLQSNIRKRAGLFDVNNGVFFELNGTTPRVVVRSKVSGSVVDTAVDQANWNIDKLDGTGPSGIAIDWTKQQLFFCDMQWLGSGSVRFGTIIGGSIVYAHQMDHANVITTPWAQFASWPFRFEIENTSATVSPGSATLTCMTLISEGGWRREGVLRTVYNGATARSFGASGSSVPVLSLRKQSAYVNIPINIVDIGAFANSADDFLIKVVVNGTLTGASFSNVSGLCQVDTSATAITGGNEVYSFYLRGSSTTGSQQTADIFNSVINLVLGSDLTGTSDVISIVGTNITATANLSAFINYKEIT